MRLTLLLSAAAAITLTTRAVAAQSVERFTLRDDATVYDPAGRVRIVAGSGRDVEVEVTRGGRDAARLRIGSPDGGRTLTVVAPEGELIYPALGRWSNSTIRVRDDGTFGDDGWGRGRELSIRGGGSGTEAWADLVIRVPRGRSLKLHLGVGAASASDVEGDLSLGTGSGELTTERTRGRLTVGTGSGRVRVRDAEGAEVRIGTGSGSAEVRQVRAERLSVGSGSGRVEGDELEGQQVRLGTGSGGVRFGRVRARRLEASAGSGGVEVELARGLEEARMSTGSGGVTVRVPSDFGATFEVTTGSGGISAGVPVRVARTERHRFTGSIGDGQARVRVSSGSGSVRIEPAR